jgi:hypothetical protein
MEDSSARKLKVSFDVVEKKESGVSRGSHYGLPDGKAC